MDYRLKDLPVSMGANMTYTPSYEVQQTALSRLDNGYARGIDAFVMWNVSRTDSLRFGLQNLAPVANVSNTTLSDGDYNRTERRQKAWISVNWEHKF